MNDLEQIINQSNNDLKPVFDNLDIIEFENTKKGFRSIQRE